MRTEQEKKKSNQERLHLSREKKSTKKTDDANWDDLKYKIYVRQSIEQGLEDSKAGRTVSHDDIKKKYQPPK